MRSSQRGWRSREVDHIRNWVLVISRQDFTEIHTYPWRRPSLEARVSTMMQLQRAAMPKLKWKREKDDVLGRGDANRKLTGGAKCAPKGNTRKGYEGDVRLCDAEASWDQGDTTTVGSGDGMTNVGNNCLGSPLGMLGNAKEGQ
ncbi:unnamed protein product [Ilex paraguariensis]|uniref:Uncharacterized protein n=1 Tax=Ilex paraguariensis TaxID=185542 RepID=A0ABC8V3T4_9AQUA